MTYFQEEEKANIKLGPCACKAPCKDGKEKGKKKKPGWFSRFSKKKVSINSSSFYTHVRGT
jgi:hypothetical protein